MGLARLVLKSDDYREVGDVSIEEIREIVRYSRPNLAFLSLLALYSIATALMPRYFVLLYLALYPIIRYIAPNRLTTASYLLPRALLEAYNIIQGAPYLRTLVDILALLVIALINERL